MKDAFYGRRDELERFKQLKQKNSASLVVVKGRRRIGKSALIQKFGESYKNFIEIQGIAPESGIKNSDQLQNFSEQLKTLFNIPALKLDNWTDAFALLASHIQKGKYLLLLDEISWMGSCDKTFAGKLKIAWDTKFKHNNRLILVLCGSVSSWIDKNILNDADFVGRVSLEIDLQELPLIDCNKFWIGNKGYISNIEKLKVLAVTGGVPKYLEEVNPKMDAESNIKNLCFLKGGFLFEEFDKIFSSIFNKRAPIYHAIVKELASRHLSALELANALQKKQNGDISEYLMDLESSGFICRDYCWKFDGSQSRLSKYRLKDNYLRFFLKYIEPIKDKVNKGLFKYRSLDNMIGWSSVRGFQFENLVLQNLELIVNTLQIDFNTIISAAPYFQNDAKTHQKCQIDLMIQTRFNTVYICEIKFRKKIGLDVVDEVNEKVNKIKKPKYISIRPVLIYAGELADSVVEQQFFANIIDFTTLLEND